MEKSRARRGLASGKPKDRVYEMGEGWVHPDKARPSSGRVDLALAAHVLCLTAEALGRSFQRHSSRDKGSL